LKIQCLDFNFDFDFDLKQDKDKQFIIIDAHFLMLPLTRDIFLIKTFSFVYKIFNDEQKSSG